MKLVFGLANYEIGFYVPGMRIWYVQTKTGTYNINFKRIWP